MISSDDFNRLWAVIREIYPNTFFKNPYKIETEATKNGNLLEGMPSPEMAYISPLEVNKDW